MQQQSNALWRRHHEIIRHCHISKLHKTYDICKLNLNNKLQKCFPRQHTYLFLTWVSSVKYFLRMRKLVTFCLIVWCAEYCFKRIRLKYIQTLCHEYIPVTVQFYALSKTVRHDVVEDRMLQDSDTYRVIQKFPYIGKIVSLFTKPDL